LLVVILGCGSFVCGGVQAQSKSQSKAQKDSIKMARISLLVDTVYYRFKAEMALPLGGHNRYLTGDNYDLEVSKDTIVAYLPYFGRAYSAPIDPSQGGIRFTSTNFTYTTSPRRKGGWDVSMKFKDAKDVQQMMLTVTQDGYATLQVTSVNRQSISFNGYISGRKKGRG
jgi:hypothetical protein